MDIEQLREYCISKPGASEEFPFDQTTLVFKVGGKMFLLTDIASDFSINIKTDPGLIPVLLEQYQAVRPGYHMDKRHWITVIIDGSVPDKQLIEWIDFSYGLVFDKLSQKQKSTIVRGKN